MPVHVEVRLVGLPFRFEQQRRFFWKRGADHVRTSLHGNANAQVFVDQRVILPLWRRRDGKQAETLAVEHDLDFLWFAKALNMLVAVAGEAYGELVLSVYRKRVWDCQSSARAERHMFEVFLLR